MNLVLEIAQLQVRPGQGAQFEATFGQAQRIISSMPGYLGHELQRCIERADHYVLLVRWESVAHHELGFRQSAGYQEWRRLLHHFYDPFPTVLHYEAVTGPGLPATWRGGVRTCGLRMNTPALIRHATPEDAATLATFAAQAFTDTYRELSDPQAIADYVAEHFQPEVMAGVIRDPACTTLLAWVDEWLAGYAVLSAEPAPSCVVGPAPLKLWRLYLGTGFIGQGLGARLLMAVHEQARQRGAQTLWLGVYDRNVRAVEFDERLGFAKVGGQAFVFGGEAYIDPVYAAAVPPRPATQQE